MTTILAIDTSSHRYVAAAACESDGAQARVVEIDAPRDHSQRLLPAVASLTPDGLDQIARVVVVRGPGSFAGLRVGIASARGLALARGVPLVGVGTLEAVAAACGGTADVAHSLGRGELAVQSFAGGVACGEPEVISVDAVRERPEIAGEGLGELGGREVTAGARCLAALELGRLRDADLAATEAIYLRDPRITAPRNAARTA